MGNENLGMVYLLCEAQNGRHVVVWASFEMRVQGCDSFSWRGGIAGKTAAYESHPTRSKFSPLFDRLGQV